MPLERLSILFPSERHQMSIEWSDRRAAYAGARLLHLRFEEQAALTPAAVALAFGSERITYRQLNRSADRLADRLLALGVAPEDRVGICLERSPQTIVAFLAVLKAGGAYLPLDPEYPAARRRYLLEDAGVRVLVTDSRWRDSSPRSVSALCLDEPWEGDLDDRPTPVPIDENHPAYVLHTSGSTGQPKATVISHGAICNHMAWMQAEGLIRTADRVLLKSSFSFDASVWEVWLPLTTGGQLILAPPEAHRDVTSLVAAIGDHRVTATLLVPSQLRVALDDPAFAGCTSLERVFTGGEATMVEQRQRFFASGPPARLINLYGPTEASIAATFTPLHSASPPTVVPIGRPIGNAAVYLADETLQPVPFGSPGELLIAGNLLARGYLDRPALTAEQFVPDPFGQVPGGRLYRTGDLARYLADGQLAFLGRIDRQVKLRGFRIELGEIEATLEGHPDVDHGVVLKREDQPGNPRLVAFVVPAEAYRLPTGKLVQDGSRLRRRLREHLVSELPGYMVPQDLVLLPGLPYLPSGKVDRAALHRRAPTDLEASGSRQAYVAPRSPIEELVVGIWSEVLGLDRVGVMDNFFDLGGHSLLATQVTSRLRSSLAVELPLRDLFEAPTIAQLAARIDRARRSADVAVSAPRRQRRDGAPPLSFAQERLWFLDQLEPGSTAYSMPLAFVLHGPLDPAILERCFDEVVRRHETLRTTFSAVDGKPLQIIAPPRPATLPRVDLEALSEGDRQDELRRLARAEAARPFDLGRGPLLRAVLVRLEATEHGALFNMHHVISDGWSMDLLWREVAVLYSAFSAGGPSPLPELDIQYADFASWQRDWLRGEVLEAQLEYWRQQLAGLPPVLELPTDRPRPALQSHRGALHHLQLEPGLSAALRTLAREQQATLFMTLLAGFQVTLARTTGELDFAIGTPIAGRNRLEIENLIGFFVNTLVLRSELTGDPNFPELVARVRDTVLDAHSHQDLPFEKLVEELQPERSLAHSALFQVMFTFQNRSQDALEIEELELQTLEATEPNAKFDLSLGLAENEHGLVGSVAYNRELFDATTIARLCRRLEILLAGAVTTPQRSVMELPLLSEVERHQLTSEWHRGGEADRKRSRIPIHRLFEAQVERTPNRVALLCGDETLSYRELNARANRLAHHLRQRTSGSRVAGPPETLIGVCLQRSPEMVIALLAVLKAGAAYVPMDPAYPAERLRYMLEDAGIDCILTDRRTTLAELDFQGQTLVIESVVAGVGSEENPQPLASPASPAYVIYTSGSTGHPKGVVVPHRSLTSYALQAVEGHRLRPQDRVLLLHSLSFDGSVKVIYPTLLEGATLLLAPVDQPTNREFLERCRRWSTTVLALPTSYWHTLMADPAGDGSAWPDSVRLTILGGEEARTEALRAWRQRASGRLLNHYGPTEGTVGATFWNVPESWDPPSREGLPIGRPMPHARIYLLDAAWRPVPVGTPGELCIAGEGVARGYLGRLRPTAEKFCPNPFGQRSGSRLYRTGDLARFLADGTLEFLGRTDHQVKVRGFRVEPGEIEAVLATLPGIREAVVTLADSERLIAYFVPAKSTSTAGLTEGVDHTLDSGELRALLKEKLPDYMVPSLFVSMDSLPRLPNGKVDRAAVRRTLPTVPRHGVESTFDPPRDSLELRLARILEEILEVRPVGRSDDFFTLGGHSLLAVRLVARIERQLGRRLPVASLFHSSTVESLAHLLRADAKIAADSPLVAISPRGNRRPLFLVHGVRGSAFSFVPLSYGLDSEQPLYAFQSAALIEGLEADLTIAAMASRYLELMQTVQPTGPYRLGGWSMGGMVAFEIAQQLAKRGEKVALLALLDTFPHGHADERWTRDPPRLIAAFAGAAGLEALESENRDVTPEEAAGLTAGELLARLVERLRDRGALAPDFDDERLGRLLEVFKTNVRAHARYRVKRFTLRRYSGRTQLLRAAEGAERDAARSRHWRRLIRHLDVREVPGDHSTMVLPPNATALAEELTAGLRAASLDEDDDGAGPATTVWSIFHSLLGDRR
ncbi:MAG: amino acid adenylation domain-containing protein [Thermoanaerobaculia bacterium]